MRAGLVLVALVVGVVIWLRLDQDAVPGHSDDYLLLAVSWTPSWCAAEGDTRAAPRCETDAGWLVHGLWPQHGDGSWPEFCDTPHPQPSRAQTAAMADIMGDGGLAFHQWRKHGTCSGLAASGYFNATRQAFAAVTLPEVASGRISPVAFLADLRRINSAIPEGGAYVTCRAGQIQELRLCLTGDLRPRACDPATLDRACRSGSVTIPPRR